MYVSNIVVTFAINNTNSRRLRKSSFLNSSQRRGVYNYHFIPPEGGGKCQGHGEEKDLGEEGE